MFTIVPDIHADWKWLDASLSTAAGIRPAFLGDFTNADKDPDKPHKRRVLDRVCGLVDGGKANAALGDHELNAILFHRQGADGLPLRAHSKKTRTAPDRDMRKSW